MITSLFKALGLILLLSINLSTLARRLRKQNTLYATKKFKTLYLTDIFVGYSCPTHYKKLYGNVCVLYSTQPTECVEDILLTQRPTQVGSFANPIAGPSGYQTTSGDFADVLAGTNSRNDVTIFQKKGNNLERCYKDLTVVIGEEATTFSSLSCPANYDDMPGKIRPNIIGTTIKGEVDLNLGVHRGTNYQLITPVRLCGTRTYPFSGVNDNENFVAFPKTLPVDTKIYSKDGTYHLFVQGDGNLQLYDSAGNTKNLWGSKTDGEGEGPYTLELQSDGNMVYYDGKGKVIWESGTRTDEKIGSKYSLVVSDDGEIRILDDVLATIWSSG